MMKVIRIRLKKLKTMMRTRIRMMMKMRTMINRNVKAPERCSTQRRKTGRKPACKGRKAGVDRHTGPPPTGRMKHPATPGPPPTRQVWAHEHPHRVRLYDNLKTTR